MKAIHAGGISDSSASARVIVEGSSRANRGANNEPTATIAQTATNARAPRCPERSQGVSAVAQAASAASEIHGCQPANATSAGTSPGLRNCSDANGTALRRQYPAVANQNAAAMARL